MEAHFSVHVEASHLSIPPASLSIHRSVQSSRVAHTSYLPDSEPLLPQLQSVGRGEGWHPSRNPLARQHDPTLCRSLAQFLSRPTRCFPPGVPMRSPFSRFHDGHTRLDPRPFRRVSRIFLIESTPASFCSHRKPSNVPLPPPSLIIAREHRHSAFSSYSLCLSSEKRRTKSSSVCTKRWLHFSLIRSDGICQPISSSLDSICISLWGFSSSHVPSSAVGSSIATVPSAMATLEVRSPRHVVRFK